MQPPAQILKRPPYGDLSSNCSRKLTSQKLLPAPHPKPTHTHISRECLHLCLSICISRWRCGARGAEGGTEKGHRGRGAGEGRAEEKWTLVLLGYDYLAADVHGAHVLAAQAHQHQRQGRVHERRRGQVCGRGLLSLKKKTSSKVLSVVTYLAKVLGH